MKRVMKLKVRALIDTTSQSCNQLFIDEILKVYPSRNINNLDSTLHKDQKVLRIE